MALTGTADLSTSTAAYDALANFALRPMLHFDQVARKRPTRQTHRGASVTFDFYDDLAAATTPLTETADVTPVAMSDSTVTVTLVEYGNAVQTTAKLRGTSFLEVDADAANVIGYNAGLSIDTLARTQLEGGTNVRYAGSATSRATVAATDTLSVADIRYVAAKLRSNSAMPLIGSLFVGFMHPDVAYDVRAETGNDAWVNPANYSDAARRWNGIVGAFEGVMWIETPRASLLTDAGSTTTDVYLTTVVGREALAKAFSSVVSGPTPRIVIGPQTDALRRFNTVGWYWLGGHARFREAALYRIESASSIGAN
ncbi:MAG: N4-gp56 family major capsid protein [Actinomyces sp.]|nr:MAG: N4-gp56 family major capsid protein [Actinomyces sp.]